MRWRDPAPYTHLLTASGGARIPTGFHPKAQGCPAKRMREATLGKPDRRVTTLKGLRPDPTLAVRPAATPLGFWILGRADPGEIGTNYYWDAPRGRVSRNPGL